MGTGLRSSPKKHKLAPKASLAGLGLSGCPHMPRAVAPAGCGYSLELSDIFEARPALS